MESEERDQAVSAKTQSEDDKFMARITDLTTKSEKLLMAALFANLAILLIFERSVWAAIASTISAVTVLIAYNKVAGAVSLVKTGDEITTHLVVALTSKVSTLEAKISGSNTRLRGKVASAVQVGDIGPNGRQDLKFLVVLDDVDRDNVIRVNYPSIRWLAESIEKQLTIGSSITVEGALVGKPQGSESNRHLYIEYLADKVIPIVTGPQ